MGLYGDTDSRLRCAGALAQDEQRRRTAQIMAAGGLDAWMAQRAALRQAPTMTRQVTTRERELAVA